MSKVAKIEDKKPEISFAAEVWETLSSIDCSKHVKDKGDFTYLSWVWAWGILMENYPESTIERSVPIYFGETVETHVTVTVKRGDATIVRAMWLPVMNFHNKAVIQPDSREISDTYMRCLVKCIALHGLGHYIYAGEDIPREEDAQPVHRFKTGEKEKIISNVLAAIEADSFEMLERAFGEGYDDLDPSIKSKIHFLFDSPTRKLIKQIQAEGEKKVRDQAEEDATEQLDIKLIRESTLENRNGS